jgi:hypothetical protein
MAVAEEQGLDPAAMSEDDLRRMFREARETTG